MWGLWWLNTRISRRVGIAHHPKPQCGKEIRMVGDAHPARKGLLLPPDTPHEPFRISLLIDWEEGVEGRLAEDARVVEAPVAVEGRDRPHLLVRQLEVEE